MSARQSPFPTVSSRRPRSPATPAYSSSSLPKTPPLSINRGSRPETPNSYSTSPQPGSGMPQPPRPMRSERRPRQQAPSSMARSSQASSSRPSSRQDGYYQDPYGGMSNGPMSGRASPSTRSDVIPRPRRARERSDTMESGRTNGSDLARPPRNRERDRDRESARDREREREREQEEREYGDEQPDYEALESPPAVTAVLHAFQQAGASRRKNTNGSEGVAADRERERRLETERRERAKARERKARARATGDIDAILDDVKQEWADVIEDDFNPVTLALALMDESESGRDMQSFVDTKRSLEVALKGSVDKHYRAFNHSLSHHASLVTSLTKTQVELTDTRNTLTESRDALGNRRADLVQLWSRGQVLEEMMKLLEEIDKLKAVPEQLESLISEKRLLQAAVLLVQSLKIINKPDMMEIGAVADLRSYLTTQEASLRDILVEELHSHLYLKTFWCDTRWTAYVPNQMNLPPVEFDKPQAGVAPSPSRLDRYLTHLTLRPSNESPLELLNDMNTFNNPIGHQRIGSMASYDGGASKRSETEPENPESDSFTYLETLLEALAALGKLVGALDTVIQRLPAELFNLVESTSDEVNDRSEFVRGGVDSGVELAATSTTAAGAGSALSGYLFVTGDSSIVMKPSDAPLALRLGALEASAKETHHETLRDLFWTLYSKLDAVVQGFRVIYEVAKRIGERRDFKETSGMKPGSLLPLVEVWTPLQNEVSALLHQYLRDNDQMAMSGRNPIASINEVLRNVTQARDKTKSVFRFVDTDAKAASKALKKHDDELSRVLKETVPGLVNAPAESVSNALSAAGIDDRFTSAGQHRLLLHPDAFHVSVLFQPTLAWLDKVTDTFRLGSSSITSDAHRILDDFVLNVYLPQLEERVLALFQQAVSGADAFREDPGWKLLSARPIVRASAQLVALINSLCAIMRVTPFHRENYSRLILGVVIQFYQRCSTRFEGLSTHNDASGNVTGQQDRPGEVPRLSMPAAWSQTSDMMTCLGAIRASSPENIEDHAQLMQQEIQLELGYLFGKVVGPEDTLGSPRNLTALANLYQSLTWFISHLVRLRQVSEDPQSPGGELNISMPPSARSPFMPRVDIPPPPPADEELKLPLTRAMVLRYDALLKTYDQLAELILYTIRLDIRCRTFHLLQKGMREESYRIDQEAQEPDLCIVDLNSELAACDEATSWAMGEAERRFIFDGLGSLMEHLLISEARQIRYANERGVRKILRNIMALQQGLKAIEVSSESDAAFEKARRYYSLFTLTPAKMLDTVRERAQFSFDEYKTMLNLQSGMDQALPDEELNARASSDYRLHIMDLQTLTI